jgi:hypothetical protein
MRQKKFFAIFFGKIIKTWMMTKKAFYVAAPSNFYCLYGLPQDDADEFSLSWD